MDFHKAAEKLNKIGDQSGSEDAFKMANTEKMKHLDEMQKQRDLHQEAILQSLEFTEKITAKMMTL